MAYALGVRLGGDNHYDGLCVRGPVFNPSGRVAGAMDIARSLKWMWRIAGASAGFFLLISFLLSYLPAKFTPRMHPPASREVTSCRSQELQNETAASGRRMVIKGLHAMKISTRLAVPGAGICSCRGCLHPELLQLLTS